MADQAAKRASKRDSEFESQRASHGSASDHQPWMESFSAIHNLSEVAAPAPAAFYDQGRIRRNTSLEETPTRKKDRRRNKSATWPKPEHSSPSASASASASASSAPKTPPNKSQQDEYSPPASYEELDEVASPPPIEDRNEQPLYQHISLEERKHALAGERSSSRRAKTKVRPRKDGRKSPLKLKSSLTSSEGIHEIGSPGPGSSGKEDATALPQYSFSQDNLEEQLAVARASQMNLPVITTPTPQHRKAARLATQLYTISYLIFFSIFGTLARLGLQWLTFYPGAPVVVSVLWANFGGSLILGILSEDRRLFREEWSSHSSSTPSFGKNNKSRETFITGRQHRSEDHPDAVAQHSRVKKTIPLYIGLAVGFCGSFTSFSSFMRDAFLSLSNNLPTPQNHPYPDGFSIPSSTSTIHRDGGYSFLALLAIILLTLSLSLSALKIGAHIAIVFDPWTPTISFTFLRKFLDRIIVFLGFGCWLGAVFLSIWSPNTAWRGDALFAVVFAPIGCLSRFYISLWLNGVSPSFPLGTFVVNIFGTAVEAMSFNLQHVRFADAVGGGRVPCQILQGVMDGYCGALTTVSTFVAELQGLRRAHSYVYGSASVVGGLVMVVAVMGGVRWGVGWEEASCMA
jgi:CrcB protein